MSDATKRVVTALIFPSIAHQQLPGAFSGPLFGNPEFEVREGPGSVAIGDLDGVVDPLDSGFVLSRYGDCP